MTLARSITRSFVVCATPRSGSELLCEALRLSGAGRPEEYFRTWVGPQAKPDVSALEDVYRLAIAPDGLFGVKLMWDQLPVVAGAVRESAERSTGNALEILASAWPNLTFLHLSRRDTLRQAVSWAKAICTGQWGSGEPESTQRLVYDFAQISWCHATLVSHDAAWSDAFSAARVTPCRVFYEDLVARYEPTVRGVLSALGLPQPDQSVYGARELARQSDAINDEWAARFLREAGHQDSSDRPPDASDPA